jgi:myo-inositol-1(or 4)-monophosphatase
MAETYDLQAIHDLLVEVAHEAGKMIMAATPRTLGSDTKKNCMSPFTRTTDMD